MATIQRGTVGQADYVETVTVFNPSGSIPIWYLLDGGINYDSKDNPHGFSVSDSGVVGVPWDAVATTYNAIYAFERIDPSNVRERIYVFTVPDYPPPPPGPHDPTCPS